MSERSKTRLAARVAASAVAAAAAVLIGVAGVSAAAASVDESSPAGGLELVAATDLDTANQAPGAVVERILTLRNTGTAGYREIELGAQATTAGLRLEILSCPAGWRASPDGPACAGRVQTVLAPSAVGTTARLTSAAALRPGGSDSLLVRLTLPTEQGVAARVSYSAVGR